MKGRKPKPTTLKVLAGNPGKRPLNRAEPQVAQGLPDCPAFLDDEAKAKWFRTAGLLHDMGLLTKADRSALAAYCTAYSRWVAAEAEVRKYGAVVLTPVKRIPMKSPYLCVAEAALETMRKFMVEFGLTPFSRSRIRVIGEGPAADEFEQFLECG
jgi:P27 family predicted phage terminase small subunit